MKSMFGDRVRAKRSLGQNFLVDPNYIAKIVAAAEISPLDTVVEIGPGRGALTERLVETGANVIAVELDRGFIEPLRERFSAWPNFRVVEQDALTVDLEDLIRPQALAAHGDPPSAKLVANLPYYISTAILQRLAEQRHLFSALVLMFQREVVDRITALPGNSDRGYLTVLVEVAFGIEKLLNVPSNAFRPSPKVHSAVIRLTPKIASELDDPRFRKLLSVAFAQKRKNIANNLKAAYPAYSEALMNAGIDPKVRAEVLTLPDWARLYTSVLAASPYQPASP